MVSTESELQDSCKVTRARFIPAAPTQSANLASAPNKVAWPGFLDVTKQRDDTLPMALKASRREFVKEGGGMR